MGWEVEGKDEKEKDQEALLLDLKKEGIYMKKYISQEKVKKLIYEKIILLIFFGGACARKNFLSKTDKFFKSSPFIVTLVAKSEL